MHTRIVDFYDSVGKASDNLRRGDNGDCTIRAHCLRVASRFAKRTAASVQLGADDGQLTKKRPLGFESLLVAYMALYVSLHVVA